MSLLREKPNAHNRRVLTPGETIRVRRQRLGWGVYEAAKRAGIGKDALLNIEKDRNYTSEKLERYKAALDAGEKDQIPSADVSGSVIAPGTNEADVAALRKEYRARLKRLEAYLAPIIAEIRLGLAELDGANTDTEHKKTG